MQFCNCFLQLILYFRHLKNASTEKPTSFLNGFLRCGYASLSHWPSGSGELVPGVTPVKGLQGAPSTLPPCPSEAAPREPGPGRGAVGGRVRTSCIVTIFPGRLPEASISHQPTFWPFMYSVWSSLLWACPDIRGWWLGRCPLTWSPGIPLCPLPLLKAVALAEMQGQPQALTSGL